MCSSDLDLVLFLDADDWLYPHAVARVVAALSPGVAQVQFRLHLVDDGGRQIGLFPPPQVKFDDGARLRLKTTSFVSTLPRAWLRRGLLQLPV